MSNGFFDQHGSWVPQGAYHPDPVISDEVAADALARRDRGPGLPACRRRAGAARSAAPSTAAATSGPSASTAAWGAVTSGPGE